MTDYPSIMDIPFDDICVSHPFFFFKQTADYTHTERYSVTPPSPPSPIRCFMQALGKPIVYVHLSPALTLYPDPNPHANPHSNANPQPNAQQPPLPPPAYMNHVRFDI